MTISAFEKDGRSNLKAGRSIIIGATGLLAVALALLILVLTRAARPPKVVEATEIENLADTETITRAPAHEPDLSAPAARRPVALAPAAREVNEPKPGPPDLAQFERLRGGPRRVATSGRADREIASMSETFSQQLSRDLPKELGTQISMGSLDCFHGGCVMSVDYRGNLETARKFNSFLLSSDAFSHWPGPKMRIENKPGDQAAGEQWCLFRSSEAAKSLLSD
jgi:hypothetical protein